MTRNDSDSDGHDEWDETALELLRDVDEKLDALERGADGKKQQAVEESRELLADLASSLGEASDRDGFEEYETVEVSEGKKRP